MSAAADTTPVNASGFKGNDSALFGIVLAVVTFWLFAQTTMNIGPLMAEDVGMPMPVMNIAITLAALFSGMFTVVLGRLGDRFGHVRRESGRVTFQRPIIWTVEAGVATIGHAHARAPVTTKPGTGRALLGTNRGTGAAGSHRAVRR